MACQKSEFSVPAAALATRARARRRATVGSAQPSISDQRSTPAPPTAPPTVVGANTATGPRARRAASVAAASSARTLVTTTGPAHDSTIGMMKNLVLPCRDGEVRIIESSQATQTPSRPARPIITPMSRARGRARSGRSHTILSRAAAE